MRLFMNDVRSPSSFQPIRVRGAFLAMVLVGVLAMTVFPIRVSADEGMWLLHRLDACPFDSWAARGLALDSKDIYHPKKPDISDAIVRLGGGTGSFVSIDGLIITNHHVAFTALQRQSSAEVNYMEEGFLARTREDEIPALGYEAFVTVGVKDVTKSVLGAVNDKMSDKERYDAIEKQVKKIVKDAEKGKDIHAEVVDFYGGMEYCLFTYFKIKDIRIVYAPPGSIGNYGGDVDNWMWPRHTGDFSLLRAYVAPDGKSAEYSEENVPYHPQKYLPISAAPLEEGDFTMVIGFPGQTRRYRSSYSIDYYVNAYYPTVTERFRDVIDILEEESEKDQTARVRLSSVTRGLNNAYKNYEGMLKGLKQADLLEKKQGEEAALRNYLEAHPDLQEKYGGVLDGIKAQYDNYRTYWEKNTTIGWMLFAPAMLGTAHTIYRWSVEQEKKDIDRDPGYMERDEKSVRDRLEYADLRYYEQADKRVLRYLFLKANELPRGSRITAVMEVCGGLRGEELEKRIDEFIDDLYSRTKVTDRDERMKMFGMKKKDLLEMDDPLIAFAAKLEVERKQMEEMTEAFAGALQKLRPQLMELRKRYGGGLIYPDANSTKRLSVGQIKGYAPRDAVTYFPFTTLTGVMEKYTGETPFDVPEEFFGFDRSKEFGRYADPATGDLPICFLSTDDVTGGNSGSPILNGKGEVIGLVFDGNYESISADFQFVPELTRTINSDSRYILFILEKFAKADELLDELTIH